MKRLRNWAEEKAAREERDRLIVELRAKGLRWKQIARVMNLTPWRVQCLHAKVARKGRAQVAEGCKGGAGVVSPLTPALSPLRGEGEPMAAKG
jgi:hypothetical protein